MIPLIEFNRDKNLERIIIDSAINAIKSRRYILGENLERFEKEFAKYCGKNYGIGVGNGFDALHLTLRALSIGKGDEVITVPNTAIPTVAAIIASGAKPKFVDVKEDCLINHSKIEAAISKKTRAIMPVHLYGQACDMNEILKIAGKYNLKVIEDCAQAHGAEYIGKRAPIGNIGCFSFYPTKNLGALGDGGMIVTSDDNLAEKLRLLRNYGQSDKYHAKINGYNSRLDDLQAAILLSKLKQLDESTEKRIRHAEQYELFLNGIVKTPTASKDNKHVYHLYVIEHERRDELMKYLSDNEIQTGIHYPIPLHLQEAYKYLGYKEGDFPVSESLSKRIVSLPMFPELEKKEIDEICRQIKIFEYG